MEEGREPYKRRFGKLQTDKEVWLLEIPHTAEKCKEEY
jgi:hypothetical protein